MRIPRIYTSQRLRANAGIALEAGPSQHLARVLRMRPGDALTLFDGRGGEYGATISALERKQVLISTGDHRSIELESSLRIHLGIALSRGDRMDWIVQKATELGVSALTPLFTEHTEVKLAGDRAARKLLHWEQVAISACEQCGRNRLPEIHPVLALEPWLAATEAQRKFVLHHRAEPPGAGAGTPDNIALLVGPEGGLSAVEIGAAEQAGYSALRLGPRVLRTETAPLAGIAILQSFWGDMRPPQ